MSRTWKRVVIVSLSAVLVGALAISAGCAPTSSGGTGSSTGTTPVKGGTMSFYIGEPAYIDPYNTQESEGTQVEQAVFDSLTRVDPLDAKKLLPAAALSWSPNADATVWTFKLNPADKFSDGTAVTANDFVYAWTRICDAATTNTVTGKPDPSVISYHLALVQGFDEIQAGKAKTLPGLKAVDDQTFQVTLTKPFADFAFVASHPALAPVPQKYVENGVQYQGKTIAYGDMPIGNGPFMLSAPWKHNQNISVVQNPNYYAQKPYLAGVDFRIFKDVNTAYTEFLAGNLDFTQIGEGQIKSASAKYGVSANGYTVNPGKQVLLGAENATYYIIFNMKDPIFSKPLVRKAFTEAINRQAISDTVFQGTRQPADNIIPPGIAGYEKGAWANSSYDATQAAADLAAAGYPGGKGLPTIKLSFNSGAGHEKIMELVQSDLKAIGVNTSFDSADFPVYLKQLDAGKFQIARLGWIADYPIQENFIYSLFQSKSGDNKSKYADPAVDTALDKAAGTTNDADRIAAYNAINKTIQASNPVAPLMFYKHHHVGSARLNNFTYDAQGLGDFIDVWMTGGGTTTK